MQTGCERRASILGIFDRSGTFPVGPGVFPFRAGPLLNLPWPRQGLSLSNRPRCFARVSTILPIEACRTSQLRRKFVPAS